jgi:hypothetical protein
VARHLVDTIKPFGFGIELALGFDLFLEVEIEQTVDRARAVPLGVLPGSLGFSNLTGVFASLNQAITAVPLCAGSGQ